MIQQSSFKEKIKRLKF